jgi:hypothetical protein
MIYLHLKDPPSSLPKARSLWREYAGFRRPQEGAADTKMYCRHSGKSISARGISAGEPAAVPPNLNGIGEHHQKASLQAAASKKKWLI